MPKITRFLTGKLATLCYRFLKCPVGILEEKTSLGKWGKNEVVSPVCKIRKLPKITATLKKIGHRWIRSGKRNLRMAYFFKSSSLTLSGPMRSSSLLGNFGNGA